eukprot:2720432-Pleurochrysis_carterae.AAC.2
MSTRMITVGSREYWNVRVVRTQSHWNHMNGSSVDTRMTQLFRDERQSAHLKSGSSRHSDTWRPQSNGARRMLNIHLSRVERASDCQSWEAACELREGRTERNVRVVRMPAHWNRKNGSSVDTCRTQTVRDER